MSNSWGHTCVKITNNMPDWQLCSGRKCQKKPEYIARYYYITGRAGRTSYADRHYCREHAERFCAKHGINIDADQAINGE